MRIFIVLFAALSAFGQQITAQPLTEGTRLLRAYYGDKRLPIGTLVWANIGDGKCAYPAAFDDKTGKWLGPDISGKCFQPNQDPNSKFDTWYRAKIAGYASTYWTGRPIHLYVVEFLPPPKDGKKHDNEGWSVSRHPEYSPLTRRAYVWGEAFKMVNVFDRRSAWSEYIITLNW